MRSDRLYPGHGKYAPGAIYKWRTCTEGRTYTRQYCNNCCREIDRSAQRCAACELELIRSVRHVGPVLPAPEPKHKSQYDGVVNVCDWCGREFQPTGPDQRRCSHSCAGKAGADARVATLKARGYQGRGFGQLRERINTVDLCTWCGNLYSVNTEKQQYCCKSCAQYHRHWLERTPRLSGPSPGEGHFTPEEVNEHLDRLDHDWSSG